VQITSDLELAYFEEPAWSPDGLEIAAKRGSGIFVLNPRTQISGIGTFNPDWQPLPGPQRNDFKNSAQFCKAKRTFMAESAFRQSYGDSTNGSNAFGECVRTTR
jgi:hypothetical protein